MNQVLIIGGCGYIGSSLQNYFKSNGTEVETVDLEWFGKYSDQNIKIDYRHLTKDFLAKYSSIILLAAHSSVKMCEHRMPAFKNNVVNFLELLDKIEDQKLIYASSSSIYGTTAHVCDENFMSYNPKSLYDITKYEIDNYALLSGKNFYGLRFGTVNGFSQNLRIDIMMNAMVHSAIKNGSINLMNAETKRPILYIQDLNRAIFEITNCPHEMPGIYNLSSFNSTSGEIASKIASILNVKIKDLGTNKIVYDFLIDNRKFCENFKFQFEGTIEKIVHDLQLNINNCVATNRNNPIEYE